MSEQMEFDAQARAIQLRTLLASDGTRCVGVVVAVTLSPAAGCWPAGTGVDDVMLRRG
jgi:hypothetical protein